MLQFIGLFFLHAIYISVTEITFESDSGIMEVRMKTFTNDLEDAIYNQTGRSMSLRTQQELDTHQALIGSYLNNRFTLIIAEKSINLTLLKCENEGDATWSYFRSDPLPPFNSIAISNQILTELFAAQSNVVMVNHKGEKRFLRFSKSTETELIEF